MEEKTVTITISKRDADELYEVIGRLICAYDYARDHSEHDPLYVKLNEVTQIFKSEAAAMVKLWNQLSDYR